MAPNLSVARTRADNASKNKKVGFVIEGKREQEIGSDDHDADTCSVSSSMSFRERFTSSSGGKQTASTADKEENPHDKRVQFTMSKKDASKHSSSIRNMSRSYSFQKYIKNKRYDQKRRAKNLESSRKSNTDTLAESTPINNQAYSFQKYIKNKRYDQKRQTKTLESSRTSNIDTLAKSTPFNQASDDSIPITQASGDSTPNNQASVDSIHINKASVDSIPINQAHSLDYSLDTSSVASSESSQLLLHHDAKVTLKSYWGVDFEEYNLNIEEPLTQVLLEDKKDAVLLMESWNKVLAFRSKFGEALIGRWRILVAAADISNRNEETQTGFEQQFWVQNILETENNGVSSTRKLENEALRLVENNLDSLALHFGQRVADIGLILVSLLDVAVRSLCPHAQYVQREAYREMKGSKDADNEVSDLFFHENECTTIQEFCETLSSYGVKPEHWLLLCDAFLWTMKNQNPYSLDHEKEDINEMGAHAKFISGMVVLPLIEFCERRSMYIGRQEFEDLRNFISIEDGGIEDKIRVVVTSAFSKLFAKIQDIEDHFSDIDIEEVSYYIFEVILLMTKFPAEISDPSSEIRKTFNRFSTKWNDLNLTAEALLLLGKEVVSVAHIALLDSNDILTECFSYLWKECLEVGILYPIKAKYKLQRDAERFIDEIATELNWTHETKRKRLFAVRTEISATGTYTHTSEELEIGARLAWRNSSKCVGRISWNTLQVRDCRHVSDNPRKVFDECVEHLKIATGGTNIQSVMTVFRPQSSSEIFGMRFWSSQFVRYAGYVDKSTGQVLGDPANVSITKLLIERELWMPPKKKSAFDVLPLVLKFPNNEHPFVYELPKEVVHEIKMEHPDFPSMKDLGLKWAAVPAITNFMMNLGGIKYPCSPFNGWFLSTEVVRNLIERYDVTTLLAPIFGINLDDKLVKVKVSAELETAVLHSFEKEKFTVVDPVGVGESFLTHCKRERESGRECPAQWSWIGGLLGSTNPTWHLEMRDFKKCPQYDYCCDPFELTRLKDFKKKRNALVKEQIQSQLIVTRNKKVEVPKVLIAYGSETGTAEQCASSLSKRLKLCSPTICTLNEVLSMGHDTRASFDYMLIICSTFGQGSPPSNAVDFFEKVHDFDFTGLKFAVLALGSSLYPDFCKAGQDLFYKMMDVGAQSICEIVKVDSARGNQEAILEWSTYVSYQVLPERLVNEIKTMNQEEGVSTSPLEYSITWLPDDSNSVKISLENMKCRKNIELCRTSEQENDATKLVPSVRHIEMECKETLNYTSGDHLAVSPLNSMAKVIRFCKCFELELAEAIHKWNSLKTKFDKLKFDSKSAVAYSEKAKKYDCNFPSLFWLIEQSFSIVSKENGETSPLQSKTLTNNTLRLALQRSLDFSFHTSTYIIDLLTMVASKLDDAMQASFVDSSIDPLLHRFEEDSDLLIGTTATAKGSDEAVQLFKDKYPTIIDFFEVYKDLFCKPIHTTDMEHQKPVISIADVLVLMPTMKDRFYSISSSDLLSPKVLSITVGLYQRETSDGKNEKGTCSSYLRSLSPGTAFDARVVKSSFRCPSDPTFPVVLIGGGTGIAPFMAFMEERAAEFASYSQYAKWHFFFGCRTKDEFLYKDKIEKWDKEGVITSHIAYSRESDEPKTYVQDLLEDNAEKVVQLLLCKDTHVMICGNASMANACRKTVVKLLRFHGQMSTISAEHLLSSMSLKKRWQLDVWGKIEEEDTKSSLSMRASVNRRHLLQSASKSQRNFLINF